MTGQGNGLDIHVHSEHFVGFDTIFASYDTSTLQGFFTFILITMSRISFLDDCCILLSPSHLPAIKTFLNFRQRDR